MKLHYWKEPGGNFGDDLNAWLWPKVLDGVLDEDGRELFVGIGTILTDALPSGARKVVFGSGAWRGRPLPKVDRDWRIVCVRGPLTAQLMGLPEDLAVVDPAVLVRKLLLEPCANGDAIGYMPHHYSEVVGGDVRSVCEDCGLVYISPSAGVESVLQSLRGCRLLFAEAMHGAIVADALRVPWVPVMAYPHILRFKWEDWLRSLGLEGGFYRLCALWRNTESAVGRFRYSVKKKLLAHQMRQMVRKATPALSSESLLSARVARLEELLDSFRQSVREGTLWLEK